MEVSHICFGFVIAFLGFMTPSMLNMTTVKTTIERGRISGLLFGFGAVIINTIHSLIAFSFLRHLNQNPDIIRWIKQFGVIVLFTLAYFFYKKSKKIIKAKDKEANMPSFFEGVLLSTFNMLSVPYYFTVVLALDAASKVNAVVPNIYFLSSGVFLGGLSMLSIYAFSADFIAKKSEFITKNLNLILSAVFTFLGSAVIVSLLLG